MLTFALPKGRLLRPAVELLCRAGYDCRRLMEDGRRLVYEEGDIRYVIAKPADVPTYVEYGAADMGIVGKDVLLEEGKDLYELLDLHIGECRFVVAKPASTAGDGFAGSALPLVGFNDLPSTGTVRMEDRYTSSGPPLRVATKFPRVAERYFQRKGVAVEIIKLHGAVELAPRLGLAEVIVDLVSTGRTLRENSLVEVEEISRASARLVANRASFRLKASIINPLVEALRLAVEGKEDGIEAMAQGGI